MNIRRRIYEILEPARPDDRASQTFDLFIVTLILLNIVTVMVETLDAVFQAAPGAFHAFEVFSVAVFSLEYVLRLWSCTSDPHYAHPVGGRLRQAARPMTIVDLVAIAPSLWILATAGTARVDLRSLRLLRCFRIFRLAKLTRYSEALQTFSRVLWEKKEELAASLLFLLTLLLITSSLMYYAEREAQPEAFASVFHAMWWAVATLTTVGYGDVYPVTGLGRMLAAVTAVTGIAMFALPTSILGAGFLEAFERRRKPPDCPHCGKRLDAPRNISSEVAEPPG
ncbi:MAG: ion transporter [Planctomycetes bacterium]|nr:ion transporter [Planctomycetota bacterium]